MPLLRLTATVVIALAGLLLSGCGYVHFGRIKPAPAPDAALASENASLRAEKIMLQRELALARKEGIALRDALEKRPAATAATGGIPAGSQSVLAAQLKETTEELINLRANYTRLEKERTRQLMPGSGMSSIAAAEQIGDL